MPALPSGTVTFLFTDVEGSTALWEQHPEAMRAALARHDVLLRDAIEANGGAVVKTTGDGFHAAFATADSAVRAAVDAQVDLVREPWADTGPLLVRIGLHTGSAEMRDGDYFGTALNRAARLMAAAHGGQIVCSHATAELVHDTGDAALTFAIWVSTVCAGSPDRNTCTRWSCPTSPTSSRGSARRPGRTQVCRRR